MDNNTPKPPRFYGLLRFRSNAGLLSDILWNIRCYVSDAIGGLPGVYFYLFFLTFVLANWVLYRNYPSDEVGHDLIPNLFAGSIESVFTILMLSLLTQVRHRHLQRDTRCLMCAELSEIHNRFVIFLYRLYTSCDGHINSDEFDFTSEEAFDFMFDERTLDKPMHKLGGLTCRIYVSREMQRLTISLDRLFARHGSYIDADTIRVIKYFESAKFLFFWSNLQTTFKDVEFLPYDYRWISNDVGSIEDLLIHTRKTIKRERCIAIWPLTHNIKSIRDFLESNVDPSYIHS